MSVGSFLEPYPAPYRYRPMGFALGATKKNLLRIFGSEDDIASHHETIKVYLRLKPSHNHHENLDLMEVLDSHTLLVKAPSTDDSRRKNPDCKYTFSKIFGAKTRQKELFAECVHPLVTDFLNGHNCLLFSFGTTNAGKTFTIQGSGEQPGIIPRVLAMTFKSVAGKLGTSNMLCPYQVMSAIELTRNNMVEIDDLKNRILYWSQNDSGHGQLVSHICGSTEDLSGSQKFCEMQHILDSEVKGVKFHDDGTNEVSVWVSFIEIYNERVFDLLDPVEKGRKRKELKLAQDHQKNNYVRGVRYIPVRSEAEAYKVLLYGKHNLQVESTNLNSSSSRSHCIFTIKLMKYSKLNHPDFVQVSSFSICDLAGSERQKKTLNDAERLKESQSINSSLHVLNRCFSIIRENQIRNEKQLIPYRDSKLTQLFKRALSGQESVTMIVNVSLARMLYEETQYALKASAIAHQIIVQPKPRLKQSTQRSSRFSQLVSKHNRGGTILWDSSVKSDTSGERDNSCDSKFTAESSQIQKLQEEVESLLDVIETLQDKLKTKKDELREERRKNRTLETDLRKQLTSEFEKILIDTRSHYKKQYQYLIGNKEKTFESTVEVLRNCESRMETSNKRKRCDSDGSYRTVNDSICDEDVREELKIAETKITGLTELLEVSKRENVEMSTQVNELKLQNGLLSHENKRLQRTTEAAKTDNTQALLDEIQQLKDIIKDRNALLEEARHDIEHETKEREHAENEIESLELEIAEKNDTIDKLKTELENAKDILSLKEERNEFLEERYEKYHEMEETADKLKVELESVKNILSIKEERNEFLEERYEKYQEMADTVEQLKNELNDANNLLSIKSKRIECLEEIQEEYQHKDEVNKKLENEIENLKKSLAEKTEELKSAEKKIEQREELSTQLEKSISNLSAKDVQIVDLEKEIKTLHTELKQSLQKNCEVEEKIAANIADLKNAKCQVRELQELITTKDQKLECLQNKLIAFEQTASILTAYKDEVEKKNSELEEYKELSRRHATTIFNLEHEILTFQNNQKTINSKYDEQLKKCKEEAEREKREAARLREQLIRITPTSKKTEEYIKTLEQKLETALKSEEHWKNLYRNRSPNDIYNQENKSKTLYQNRSPNYICNQENKSKNLYRNRSPNDICNQENKSVRKKKVAKSLLSGVCTRSMKASSVDDGIAPLSERKPNRENKSSQKKGKQNPLIMISSDSNEKRSNDKSEQSLLLGSSRKARRRLYNTEQFNTNDEDTEQIEVIPFTFRHSPNSVIKCNLRQKLDH